MLTMVFTALMYGPAMPLMYFLGALGLIILYSIDKYMGRHTPFFFINYVNSIKILSESSPTRC